MNISCYLLIGFVLSAILAWRRSPITSVLLYTYWAILLLWSIKVIAPFTTVPIMWVPSLDIQFSYHLDGLSKLFTALISGIGIIVFLFTKIYSQADPAKYKRLAALLQLFAVSMLGLVLADNLIALFVFWELTSISSYLLIQFNTASHASNQAAFNSLFISVLGSLVMLVGFIELHSLFATWEISQIMSHSMTIGQQQNLHLCLWLILAGVITKSAQFPFYFWLTGAMQAPAPVSAYLHSATMVNAGIYLLARFHPLFHSLELWYCALTAIGTITMVLASLASLFQDDLKAVLAYSTVFALGAMVYLLGGSNAVTIEAFSIFLVFHAIYKAGAFMLAGVLEKRYHTRELQQLAGIGRRNWLFALIAIVTFGAMAGLPPFFGFTVKEMIFKAKLSTDTVSYVLMTVSILSSMLIAAASFRCLFYFFKRPAAEIKSPSKLSLGLVSPLILATLIIIITLISQDMGIIISPTVKAILPTSTASYLDPNSSASYLLSLMTVFGGIVCLLLYILLRKFSKVKFGHIPLDKYFEASLTLVLQLGRQLTRLTQGQTITNHLRIIVSSIAVLLLATIISGHLIQVHAVANHQATSNLLICSLLIMCSLSLLLSCRFLYNLISLSLLGLGLSLFFVTKGAVDVAIAQLLVEVLSVIILLLVLRRVDLKAVKTNKSNRIINGVIALLFGMVVTELMLATRSINVDAKLQNYYIDNSLLLAHGRNIVNVILVDFRSLDTFAEAIVIVATAIGVSLLLKQVLTTRGQSHVDNT